MKATCRLADIPAEVWMEDHRPGALFCSADWFRVAEISGAGMCFLLTSEPAPTVLPFHSIPVGTGGAYDHESYALKPALGELATEWEPCLTVGSWTSTISAGPIGSHRGGDFSKAIENLLAMALSLADERGNHGVSWPFLTPDAGKLIANLLPAQVLLLRSLPSTLMTINQNSFDDYLSSLSSQSRWSFLRDERKFSAASLRLSVQPLSEIRDEIADFYVDGRQLGRGRLDAETTHTALTQVFGDRALAFTARQGGKLAAVATAVVSHGGLYIRSYAADKEIEGSKFAYFVVTYNAPQRYACDNGLRWIHAGVRAYEAKARRNFRLVPLWTAFITSGSVTARQRDLAEAWNVAHDASWRDWYETKLGTDLPSEWEWPS